MQSTFCSSCGHGIQATANFCERCGVAIEKPLPYLMSVHRVVTMSLLSGGIYLLWWAYITWKHYRDHTGEEAYPVWHALTLLVPIYDLFRIHAHTRTFKELMMARQLTNSIRPGIAVVIILFVDCLGIIGRINVWSGEIGEISEGLAVYRLVAAIISTALIAWLLVSVQDDINKYWRSVSPNALSSRLGIGEVLLTILGIVFWADTIATAFIESR